MKGRDMSNEDRERYFLSGEDEERLDKAIKALEGEYREAEGFNTPGDIALLQLVLSHLIRKYGAQVVERADLEREYNDTYGVLILAESDSTGKSLGRLTITNLNTGDDVDLEGKKLLDQALATKSEEPQEA